MHVICHMYCNMLICMYACKASKNVHMLHLTMQENPIAEAPSFPHSWSVVLLLKLWLYRHESWGLDSCTSLAMSECFLERIKSTIQTGFMKRILLVEDDAAEYQYAWLKNLQWTYPSCSLMTSSQPVSIMRDASETDKRCLGDWQVLLAIEFVQSRIRPAKFSLLAYLLYREKQRKNSKRKPWASLQKLKQLASGLIITKYILKCPHFQMNFSARQHGSIHKSQNSIDPGPPGCRGDAVWCITKYVIIHQSGTVCSNTQTKMPSIYICHKCFIYAVCLLAYWQELFSIFGDTSCRLRYC